MSRQSLLHARLLLTSYVLYLQELTYIIKQDIAQLNKQIAQLQAFTKANAAAATRGAPGKQVEEHHNNVVMLLQSKLVTTSMSFKDVLEIRTQVRPQIVLRARSQPLPNDLPRT